MQHPDLSVEHIAKLQAELQKQDADLYSFLKQRFPDISVEDRLKYLSTVLNDYFEAYEYDEEDEMSVDGYIIKRFFPKTLP